VYYAPLPKPFKIVKIFCYTFLQNVLLLNHSHILLHTTDIYFAEQSIISTFYRVLKMMYDRINAFLGFVHCRVFTKEHNMNLLPSSSEGVEDTYNVGSIRVRVRVTLQLTVSQSVYLGVEPNLGLLTRDIFFKS
jgi:hypothetical protein